MFAFEIDENLLLMKRIKEGFKTHSLLPTIIENPNAILDVNIYNIAKSRRKQIFGLESLEEHERYMREVHEVKQVRIQIRPF